MAHLKKTSITPPGTFHGMWGGRMTSCVAVPTKKIVSWAAAMARWIRLRLPS